MIQSIRITNSGGDVLDINLRSSLDDHGLLVFNLEGLGSPKAEVTGLSGPTYDGIAGEFVRAGARQLLLTLAIPARGDAEEVAKQKVYDHFRVKETITFRVITDAQDVYAPAIVESVEMNQFSKVENAVISLYCPDPYFLDMVETWEYGEYGGTTQTINYEGTAPTGTYIVVLCGDPWSWGGDYESLGYCTIENDRDDQSMTIEFISFSEGDRYFIDSYPGQKSVWHEDGDTHALTDVTSWVVPTSDWIVLHPGDNDLSVVVGGTYQGPHANRPPTANLLGYLPLNELEDDPGELVGDRVFRKDDHLPGLGTGELGNDTGILYPTARQFDKDYWTFLLGPNDSTLNPLGDYTLIFWAYIEDFTNFGTILDVLGGGPNGGINIRVSSTSNLQYGHDGWNDTIKYITISTAPLNTWTCFFCWFDASATTMYLSMNNATPVSRSDAPAPTAYSSPWRIGEDIASSFRFTGRLQGLGLYNIALSAAQRTWVYNSGKGRTYGELVAEHELDVLYRPRYQGV
jgi:hypothetical protein